MIGMKLGKKQPRLKPSTGELGLFAFEKFANMVNYINDNLSEQVKKSDEANPNHYSTIQDQIRSGKVCSTLFYPKFICRRG